MTYEFVDEVSLDKFYDVDNEQLDEYIQKFITQDIYTTPDPRGVMPSSKAILDLLNELQSSVDELNDKFNQLWLYVDPGLMDYYHSFGLIGRIEIITGSIKQVKNPNRDVLYVQHNDRTNKHYTVYIWTGTDWITVNSIEAFTEYLVPNSEIYEYRDWVKEKLAVKRISDEEVIEIVHEEYRMLA